jgi:lipoprotein-releasing system permease protein
MKLPVEIFIALRYLKARKNGFFSLITTAIAVGGTTLGVAALIITLSVMSGFQTDIRAKILGVQPHILIARIDGTPFVNGEAVKEKVLENEEISGASPYIYRQAIIRSLSNRYASGIVLKAVDYKTEDAMTHLSDLVVEQDSTFNDNISGRSIVLGQELSRSLEAFAGDEVVLMFPSDLNSIPQMYKFKVAAVLYSGIYDIDSSLGFMDIDEAQNIFDMQGEIAGLGIRFKNVDEVDKVAEKLKNDLGYPYSVRTWTQMNKNLFAALKLEKIMMFLILGLIILVAAFNIISNLLLLSVQKFKEIGIMSAIGFSRSAISKIFFYEGMIVGFAGTLLGLIFGLGISLVLKHFEIFTLPKGVYYVDRLPIAILYQDVLFVALSAFIVTVLAGIYPAYQVSKLDPLQAMRGE